MADCMPFFGIADLREVLTAVKDRHAQSVQQCRPLKAARYLEVWSYTVNFATKLLRFKASVKAIPFPIPCCIKIRRN